MIYHAASSGVDGGIDVSSAHEVTNRHCRYSSRNLAEVQERLRAMRDGVMLSVSRPEDFVSYSEVMLAMGTMTLTIGCIDARGGYDLSFRSGDEYLITIPLRGTGWAATGGTFVEYSRNDVMIVAPLCRVDKHWDEPGEVLSIHIPAERFDAAIADMNAATLPSAPILRVDSRRLRSFLRIVDMICDDLQDASGVSPFLRAPLSNQAETMLLTVLLEELCVDAGAGREPAARSPAIPYYVRRAEKYIAANAHRSVGIDDIAQAAGVSTRTIQYGFRKFFDTSPMLRLKQVRYERAREILLADRTGRKISDIAVEIGCQNISQFSRDYRMLFGETPSRTLAAPKGLVS